MDDCFGLLCEGLFLLELTQKVQSLFFYHKIVFTWKGNAHLFDDFEKLNLVDILLESFHELSVEVETNFSFNLRVKQESQHGH